MYRVFITGSSDGLGLLAGRMLVEQGHTVVLHARNEARARETRQKLPACEAVVVGDVSTLDAMRSVAEQANALGRFDAVIHNVALGSSTQRVQTVDGLSQLFAVNVVAPYVLTALMERPDRLVFMSSGMHTGGDAGLDDLQWAARRWNGSQAYSDTKFHDLVFALLLARRWSDVSSNAVNPGWVPTRMGGRGAPDDLTEGAATQAWLAVSDEPAARVSGEYFFHMQPRPFKRDASRHEVQDRLASALAQITGLVLP